MQTVLCHLFSGWASRLLQRLLPGGSLQPPTRSVLQMLLLAVRVHSPGLDSTPGMRLEGNVGIKLCVWSGDPGPTAVHLSGSGLGVGENQEGNRMLGPEGWPGQGSVHLKPHFLQVGSFFKAPMYTDMSQSV